MSATYLDSSVFIGAYDSGKLIGFIKLVIDDSGSQAGMMHIISMLQSRDEALRMRSSRTPCALVPTDIFLIWCTHNSHMEKRHKAA